jgi:hypothetical protein
MGTYSLAVETVNTSGAALGNTRLYIKGGYKRYNSTTNTAYYYDNLSPTDNRLVTDVDGLGAVNNLVPGGYYFCGDAGATSCTVGGSTYYLAAAVPYGGDDALSPVTVPTYTASNPPATTYPYASNAYLQKVRLILTNISAFPRLTTLTPNEASISTSAMTAFPFQITGANLPCTGSPVSCNTTVSLKQGASTFPASCTGAAAGTQLSCTVNLSGVVAGSTQLVVTANGHTLTLPDAMPLGGINVIP